MKPTYKQLLKNGILMPYLLGEQEQIAQCALIKEDMNGLDY